jgi:nucleoside-diphosphate kinase
MLEFIVDNLWNAAKIGILGFLLTILYYLISNWRPTYVKPSLNREPERTLVLLKPDCVKNNAIGRVTARFENNGLEIVGMRMFEMPKTAATNFYHEHAGKDFFDRNVEFMTSGPIVAMVLEGDNVINAVRQLIGDADPTKAKPGTIRGDFGTELPKNAVHASDSESSAEKEIKQFF